MTEHIFWTFLQTITVNSWCSWPDSHETQPACVKDLQQCLSDHSWMWSVWGWPVVTPCTLPDTGLWSRAQVKIFTFFRIVCHIAESMDHGTADWDTLYWKPGRKTQGCLGGISEDIWQLQRERLVEGLWVRQDKEDINSEHHLPRPILNVPRHSWCLLDAPSTFKNTKMKTKTTVDDCNIS